MSTPTPTPGPQPQPERSWEARPWAARAIRLTVALVPIAVGCAAAIATSELLPVTHQVVWIVFRTAFVVAVSTGVVWVIDGMARRFLPLAALMSLSLVFPDHAPSRFKSALKSGSSRRLERLVDDARTNGLADDPGDAARQVVQLIGAIGDHDRRTRGHSERVRLYADLLGEELKLSKEDRQKLQWGALLHDLGKLMVPAEILNKPGKPDPDEWAILQTHPAAGMDLIEPMRDFLGEWAHAIGGHHEKWDGTGYPAHLAGRQIPRAGTIVAVADSFEVMTAVRSYKKSMSLTDARAELTRCAGTHFAPDVVRAFLSISLGELRLAAGPLAALAHLPFLGTLTRLPGVVGAATSSAAGAAAVPVAAAMMATALVATPTTTAFTASPAAAIATPAGPTTPGSPPLTSRSGGPAPSNRTHGTTTAPTTAPTAAAADANPSTANAQNNASHTNSPVASNSSGGGTVNPNATTTTAPNPTHQTAGTTTTTAKGATPTTSVVHPGTTAPAPTTTPPPTTAPPATTTTAAPTLTLTLWASTNSLRIPATQLNGASYPAGTTIYIDAATTGTSVHYTYPGGTRTATTWPWDMMGGTLLAANGFTVPTTKGTYTITATATGNGNPVTVTVTATFTST